MGEKKAKARTAAARRAEILAAHPNCCFCEGSRPATTIDHVPARICFLGKEGPEDFEFSACSDCNNLSGISEVVTALYIRMAEWDQRNQSNRDLDKLISAVANNAPDCLPQFDVSANRKRQLLRDRLGRLPPGMLLEELPAISVPPPVGRHFEIFARKLIAAVHFKNTGLILGADHDLFYAIDQVGTVQAKGWLDFAITRFGPGIAAGRRNKDLRNQFVFNHAYNAAHGFSGLYAQFGLSFCFFCIAAPKKHREEIKLPMKEYRRLRDLNFISKMPVP